MGEKQTHKDTLVIWHEAVQLFDRGDRARALDSLQLIQEPSAKILYNIGHIQMLESKTHYAVQTLKKSTEKDQHMGIAHFQLAQTYYQQHNYDAALHSLEKARTCLRGNKFIDYKQLGLQYKLHECEILHNLALTYAALNETQLAMDLMTEASRCKAETKHNTIDSALTAIKERSLPKSFVVPEEHIFRPPAAKVQNIKGVDYLGKAKVVSELVIPDTENKRGRSPSPIPPQHLPPHPIPIPSNNFKPITQPTRSPSPNPKTLPSYPPPTLPSTSHNSAPLLPNPPLPNPLSGTSPSPSPTLGAKATHKDTISMWNEGVVMFEHGQVGPALDHLLRITEPPAKILFNIGMLHLKLGNVYEAEKVFKTVVDKDPHLAIGYYQDGNVQCQLNRPEQARRQYEKCLGCFRGHKFIDYKQLGLPYKLYEFEVLHNQAWTFFKLGQREKCNQLLLEAQGTKPETKHDAIDNSLKNAKAGAPFDIMKLPKGALFRPPKAKIDNLNKIDFLGQAKVVSTLNTGGDRSTSPAPTRSLSPPQQATKPKDNQSPRKSLPGPPPKSLPEPPRRSLPGPPSKASNLALPSLPSKPFGVGQDLPAPVPPRTTSLGGPSQTDCLLDDNPSPSPCLPSRPIPPVPNHDPIDSTIPRRMPPPPPLMQNGHAHLLETDNSNLDRKRKVSPAFNPNQPLPLLPKSAEKDEQTFSNLTHQRPVSPIPPSRPVPPSPNRNSPVTERQTPPNKPVPPSPNRLSPGMPNRTPPPIPSDTTLEQKRPPVSPLPPKAPLPPPPLVKEGATQTKSRVRDANGRSPGMARKISQEARERRDNTGINSNGQSDVVEFMVAVQSFIGKDSKELSFSKGEIIRQCRQVSCGLLEGEFGGKRGCFPSSAVQNFTRTTAS
ncbi:uncharacterized protein LOC119720162 isoform X2 [Patiria miniata]|uniref:SH3 domain-containing protein n=1 Tax=Patiria miniata TaxID=46514 RepID=A0A913Z3Q6_PATMI|nr:uncharacterized protein LOC119720162 isoform X2 [Patiria miniata]